MITLPGRTIFNCEQRSAAWHTARLGRVTASHAADIVTPTGKAVKGKARLTYLYTLAAERMTGRVTEHFVTVAMQQGTEREPKARAYYELVTGRYVEQVGFVVRDDHPGCGCSPDGICGDRLLEIKCGLAHTVIGQVLSEFPPEEYLPQITFQMWVCGIPLCDLLVFGGEPGIPSRIWTIAAGAEQAAYDEHIPAFVRELDAVEAQLTELGGIKQAVRGSDEAYEATVDAMGPLPDKQGR